MTAGPSVPDRRVVRAGSADHRALEADGWTEVARSWAAELDTRDLDRDRLARLVERAMAQPALRIRELTASPTDAAAVFELDRMTAGDYPGDVATAHDPLSVDEPVVSDRRRAWGAFDGDLLVALTVLEIDRTGPEAGPVETGFTVVRRGSRGRGLGSAVKAASVLALSAEGHQTFRTGGAAENTASLRANAAVGYQVDEEWVTLRPPEPGPAESVGRAWARPAGQV